MKTAPGIRGSSKHVLDWLGQGVPQFLTSINKLLLPTGAVVSEADTWMPVGRSSKAEMKEARLNRDGLGVLTSVQQRDLAKWWIQYNGNMPNWDFASSCSIGGTRGLVLIEAKAHPRELFKEGKTLKCRKDATLLSIAKSKTNHECIGHAIDEARMALCKQFIDIDISINKHYQLSNRIAFAWKLGAMGIPIVLIYLGFLNDQGLRDIDTPIVSDESWRGVMEDYIAGVVPQEFLGRQIDCGKASMQMIVRSLPVIEVSPSKFEAWRMQDSRAV